MRGTPEQKQSRSPPDGIIPAYAGNTVPWRSRASRIRDHPRVCGEHHWKSSGQYQGKGSSPRMRGTRSRPADRVPVPGIIPAYAGNTCGVHSSLVPLGDHPRVCGEHMIPVLNTSPNPGSSPRMRGTHQYAPVHISTHGIIPAYAGNTMTQRTRQTSKADHPRVCGEHAAIGTLSWAIWGSSPRMRGTLFLLFIVYYLWGIIPAYAGNTRPTLAVRAICRDHPRVCGEHLWNLAKCCKFMGIIPAYAGNTGSARMLHRSARDHPRVCGEHAIELVLLPIRLGSSPRMRGTPVLRGIRTHGGRIIPAYAGNTCLWHWLPFSNRDHPRVCGEHPVEHNTGGISLGSSPRMRGTRAGSRGHDKDGGIIPAYAGNTHELIRFVLRNWDHPRVCGEH